MDLSINEGTLVVTGGIGDSPHTAIVIRKTPKGFSAAGAEHLILTQRYGVQGRDWLLTQHELLALDGRTFDTFRIAMSDHTERTIYFDVTDWLARVGSHVSAKP